MSFITNNTEFGIVSDSDIFSIINNFSDEMILDIIQTNSETKFRPYQVYVGNLVSALESSFKSNAETYPQFYAETTDRRSTLYSQILFKLCNLHGLSLDVNENTDLYSLTYFLYDFIISKFTINMINFFANYISHECNTLYNYLELNEMKKNKDSSAIYSKKIFKGNIKLATICSNMEMVVDNICAFDIDLFHLVLISTGDPNIAALLNDNLGEISSLFKNLFVPYIKNPSFRPNIITMIRMRLQEMEGSIENNI